MNDEIKEFNEELYVEMLENGELYDYITNLQQENERLKEIWEDTRTFIKDDKKLMMNKNGYDIYEDYKSRIEKAVEYVEKAKEQDFMWTPIFMKELLNILNGGSDE